MEERVPEIRFKGFAEPWEEKKWSDTVDISKEMVDPRTGAFDSLPHIAPGNIESFSGQLFDNVKLVKDENLISGKFHFYDGDIVYGKINPQLGKFFYAKFEGLTSADAYVLNSKNGLQQKFLYSVLQTADFFNYSVAVSRRSGMPKINREELNAYCFLAPNEEKEQIRIGEMLLSFDNLISCQQQKLDQLKTLKKACLEKMFPKEGETVPKIRFHSDNGRVFPCWKREKMDYLFTISAGGDLDKQSFSPEKDKEHPYPVYANALTENGLYGYSSNFTVSEDSVTITGRGDIGHAVSRYGKYTSIVRLLVCIPKRKGNMKFFEEAINLSSVLVESTGVPQLTVPQVKTLILPVPSLDEQEKIGSFFTKIDNLISFQQQKLDQLKILKKALLDKMFV